MKDKTVLVVGTGISGIGAARLLEKVGARVILFDENEKLTAQEVLSRFSSPVKVQVITGKLPEDIAIDLVVLSPGVPIDKPFLDAFKEKNIPIWGEVELAYNLSKGRLLAITGTNGKTTTTALVGQIMSDYYKSVYVVGNIGTPYTGVALDTTQDTITVAEISSFQLETIHDFHPAVSAILNITPDHLNRHHTMECYIQMKERICENQTADETVVLNYDDPLTRKFGEMAKCKVVYFSRQSRLNEGIWLDDDGVTILWGDGNKTAKVLRTDEMLLLGSHNVENVMAACGMAISFGVPIESIRETVKNFKAVEHRIEFVKEVGGVAFYNDSKGTNVDAAIKGIQAMNRPTVLIGGGYDKHSEYDEWIEAFDGKVKYLVLLGQTAEKIAECARKHGFENIIFVQSLKEAVDVCYDKAQPGDAVLLSPACASWGMFDNYEQRGRMFKDFVRELA